ncbi:MAG: hypothetical protein ACJATI_001284 [Halioglobus sp.]|jgi:hypothetical protein
MFNQDTNIIMLLFLSSIFISCGEDNLGKSEIDIYVSLTQESTSEIHNQIEDHFECLIDQEREIVLQFIANKSWSVDPVIYLNESKKRIVTNLFCRQVENRGTKVDVSRELVGAFINEKWHFLQGSTTYYPRDNYKYDYSTPFTFEEMSFLANRYLFPRVVSYEDGEYNVSKEFFSSLLGELDSSEKDGDSLFIERVNGYSSKSIPKEKLERIRKEQRESKPITVAKPSLWSQWFGKKKLFDSKEWKNRRKE